MPNNNNTHTAQGLLVSPVFFMVICLFLFSGCNLSPESGGKILFLSNRDPQDSQSNSPLSDNTNNDVYQMDENGNNITRITNTEGCKQYASFSPDGKKIVFEL